MSDDFEMFEYEKVKNDNFVDNKIEEFYFDDVQEGNTNKQTD